MARRTFGLLRVRVEDGAAHLSFFLTTPFFESRKRDGTRQIVRIYRKTEPDFIFGQDYAEYFDGLDYREAEVIFDGALPAINERKYEFTDEHVCSGGTYAYWVCSDRGDSPTGPCPVRVRDPQLWWSQARNDHCMDELAADRPETVSLEQYGVTASGRPIRGLRVGDFRNVLALVGAIHAGESGPELILPATERLLEENGPLLDEVGLAVLPSVNIDQRERLVEGTPWYLRVNRNGVDVNRNFEAGWERIEYGYGLISSDPDSATYRGPRPASEPETQAVVRFLEQVRPRAVLSYHYLASLCGARMLAPSSAEGDPAFARKCGQLVKTFATDFRGRQPKCVEPSFNCSAGSLPEYCYQRLGVPCFDLEWDGNPDTEAACMDGTTREMLGTCQQQHFEAIRRVLRHIQSGNPE